MARKASWTICSPMKAQFRGKKAFEIFRRSPRGPADLIICSSILGKMCLFSTSCSCFLSYLVERCLLVRFEAKNFILSFRIVAFER